MQGNTRKQSLIKLFHNNVWKKGGNNKDEMIFNFIVIFHFKFFELCSEISAEKYYVRNDRYEALRRLNCMIIWFLDQLPENLEFIDGNPKVTIKHAKEIVKYSESNYIMPIQKKRVGLHLLL